MMVGMEWLIGAIGGIVGGAIVGLIAAWRLRRGDDGGAAVQSALNDVKTGIDRTERAVREEIARSREEAAGQGRQLREEINA